MNTKFPNSPSPDFQSSGHSPALPPGWTWTTLGEILDLIKGKKPRNLGQKSATLKIPYINIEAFEKKLFEQYTDGKDSPLCEPTDILIVWDGARCGLVGRGVAGAIGSTLAKLVHHELNPSYLFYFLQSKYENINKRPRGVGIPHVEPNLFWNIPLPLPPLAEQRRIVAKIEELFSKLDAGVEALKKVKAGLKRYRQSVLKHAFEGRLTEDYRRRKSKVGVPADDQGGEGTRMAAEPRVEYGAEDASALLARIREERKKALGRKYKELPPIDTSDLPALPEGWAWARIGELCFVQGGFAFKSRDYQQKGVPLLRISNIVGGKVSFEADTVYLDDVFLSQYQPFTLSRGDIVIALSGATTGKYGVYGLDEQALLNQRVGRLRFSDAKIVNPHYILQYLEIIRDRILKEAYGAAQPNISTNDLGEFEIPLAPRAEQDLIVSEIERRFSIAHAAEKVVDESLNQAERLRQSILKRAFEGKLVPQDPSDEPAEVLLERIRAEKEKNQTPKRSSRNKIRSTRVRASRHG